MQAVKYEFKTEPRGKQREVIESTWNRAVCAFLCRPGTGKTKIGLDTAGFNFQDGRIDALVVIAPEGVDRQWIEEGVPRHLGDAVPRVCGNYRSTMGKQAYAKLEAMATAKRHALYIFTLSFDGMQTPRGKKLLQLLQKNKRYMCIDDESHRTANPKSAVYKALKPVMRAARVKRIATGTLVRQNPFSVWGQFELMGDGLLGFGSLAAFKSMYSQLLTKDNPLMKAILRKVPQKPDGKGGMEPRYIPQVLAKDDNDRPIYRNMRDLRDRLSKHSVFLTLADVNGKEPIVNETTRYVQLTKDQQVLYDDLVKYGVSQAPGGQLTAEGSLALAIRLAQVAGGFAPSDDDPKAQPIGDKNPKLLDVQSIAEELCGEKLVIWCKFSAEIDAVVSALSEVYGPGSVVQYHGRMTGKEKDASKQAFINEAGRLFFVGQQKAGGTGLDGLQGVCNYMAFYSNDYSYLERLQAISRLARTDGADTVQVWDIIAEHTVDEDVVTCLRTAQDVSDTVLRKAIVREWE